jgi:hypothetical protein
MRRHALITATLTILAAAAAAPAHASRTQESIFQDDRLLLSASTRTQALDEIDSLGVDTIHTLVIWSRIAPDADSTRRPEGFDADNPAEYSASGWDPYDALVREAAARGLDVILTPTGPTPVWASQCGGSRKRRRICNPDPGEFVQFVTALGKRYSGTYADENASASQLPVLPGPGDPPTGSQSAAALPRVDRWSIWNEPNQAGWLYPQQSRRRGRRVFSAARRYRGLFSSATKALTSTGHGDDQLLLGETAPIGRRTGSLAKRSLPPLDFYRALFCIDRRGRKLRGLNARLHGCGASSGIRASGVSHHPYTAGAGRPPRSRARSGDVTIAVISRLVRVLDQAARRGRFNSRAPIYSTEFGFQTEPPDPIFGVSLTRQADYLNESDWIAFRTPRLRSVAQYELRDEPNLATFNTGIRFEDGRAKPSYQAYRTPIWVTKASRRLVKVFGQVRGSAAGREVEIQNRRTSRGSFETVARATTGAKGYFVVNVRRRSGRWRLRWTQGGETFFSRKAKAASR